MILKIIRFLQYFIPFTLFLFFSQQFVINNYCPNIELFNSMKSIYLFLASLFLSSFVLFLIVNVYFFNQSGYAFMAFGIIKMIASVFFLMPLINSNKIDKTTDVLMFFAPFFLFLFFETIHSVKILNSK